MSKILARRRVMSRQDHRRRSIADALQWHVRAPATCASAQCSQGKNRPLQSPQKQLATTAKKRRQALLIARNTIFQGTFCTGPMLTKNKRTDSDHDSCQAQKRRRSIFSPPLRAVHLVRAGCCTSVPCGPKHPSKKNLREAIFFHEKQKKAPRRPRRRYESRK